MQVLVNLQLKLLDKYNTRKNLNKDKSLIGFIGAPWTLLVYMLKLKNNNNEFEFVS